MDFYDYMREYLDREQKLFFKRINDEAKEKRIHNVMVLAGFLWIRYKQRKAVKLMFERNAGRERQHPRGEIIDAEYEIIDDNKH